MSGGVISVASLAIPRTALGTTDDCMRQPARPQQLLSSLHSEFLLLWILLTASAATCAEYSAATTGNTAQKIYDAILADARYELNDSKWEWPNLTKARAMNMITTLVNHSATYVQVQADVKAVSPPNPWGGSPPHPGMHELVRALGIN